MGLKGVGLIFPAQAPSPAALAAEAERLGGMTLNITPAAESAEVVSVAFAAFPEHEIQVSRDGAMRLFVTDHGQRTPTLFELLMAAGVSLGGQPERDHALHPPLALPLNEAAIRKEIKSMGRVITTGAIAVLAVLIAVLAFVAGAVWLLWRGVNLLF
jgi:hypothetical protein